MSDYSFSSAINAMGGMSQGYEQMKRRKQDERMAAIANIIDAMKTYGGRQERLGREKRGYQHDIGMTRLGTDEAIRRAFGLIEPQAQYQQRIIGMEEGSERRMAPFRLEQKKAEGRIAQRQPRPAYVDDYIEMHPGDPDALAKGWKEWERAEVRLREAYAKAEASARDDPSTWPKSQAIFSIFLEGFLPIMPVYKNKLTDGEGNPNPAGLIEELRKRYGEEYDWNKLIDPQTGRLNALGDEWFYFIIHDKYFDDYVRHVDDMLRDADPMKSEYHDIKNQAYSTWLDTFRSEQPPYPGEGATATISALSEGVGAVGRGFSPELGFASPQVEEAKEYNVQDLITNLGFSENQKIKNIVKDAEDVSANISDVKEWTDFYNSYREYMPITKALGTGPENDARYVINQGEEAARKKLGEMLMRVFNRSEQEARSGHQIGTFGGTGFPMPEELGETVPRFTTPPAVPERSAEPKDILGRTIGETSTTLSRGDVRRGGGPPKSREQKERRVKEILAEKGELVDFRQKLIDEGLLSIYQEMVKRDEEERKKRRRPAWIPVPK
jgi:hypothetical protein